MARLVSKIYGEALFNYAKEQNQLEKMCEEAYDILAVLESSNELKDFIVNPKISLDEKVSFMSCSSSECVLRLIPGVFICNKSRVFLFRGRTFGKFFHLFYCGR